MTFIARCDKLLSEGKVFVEKKIRKLPKPEDLPRANPSGPQFQPYRDPRLSRPKLDRSALDRMIVQCEILFAQRDACESCFSQDWRENHAALKAACAARRAELSRMWALDPWGDWLSPAERCLAQVDMRL